MVVSIGPVTFHDGNKKCLKYILIYISEVCIFKNISLSYCIVTLSSNNVQLISHLNIFFVLTTCLKDRD